MSAPTFIVGTGRCGSTLLSSMLQHHPRLTSVSELISFVTDLGGRVDRFLPDATWTGAELWRAVATPWPRANLMLQHDVAMPEVRYPWREPGARFSAASGVPAIAQVVLPHLSEDPDALFEALEAFCLALPPAPAAQQYRRMLDHLAQGSAGWVERSGGSLRVVARLRRAFPDARFVHIVRDGRTASLSMSRHRGFRFVFAAAQLTEMLGADPFETDDRRWEEDLPDDLAALLPERFTKAGFEAFETPAVMCAHYWSGEIMQGLAELDGLGAEQLLTQRYEDFLAAPEAAVARLESFLLQGEPGDAAWAQRAAASVRSPTSSLDALSARDRRELEDAVAPGRAALSAHGVTWS